MYVHLSLSLPFSVLLCLLPSPPPPRPFFSLSLPVGTFAVVELMIGNALDRTLESIGRSDCHSKDVETNATAIEQLGFNVTSIDDCDSLKVEIAVTLAFLTGIIMVRTH